MKKAPTKKNDAKERELRDEYRFNYRKAKPNRFADRYQAGSRVIVLDADVAKVFTTTESVNSVLRALMQAMPQAGQTST